MDPQRFHDLKSQLSGAGMLVDNLGPLESPEALRRVSMALSALLRVTTGILEDLALLPIHTVQEELKQRHRANWPPHHPFVRPPWLLCQLCNRSESDPIHAGEAP